MNGVSQQGPSLFNGDIGAFPNKSNQATTPKAVYDYVTGGGGTGGFIPFVGTNYISVKADGTPTQNGTKLLAAFTAAYALTPNGAALSGTNRAAVLLLPGSYSIGNNTINIGQYVDVIGLGDSSDILIQSNIGVFTISGSNDYTLRNLSLSGGASFTISGANDNGNWYNLILYAGTTDDINYTGNYEYLNCQSDNILPGSIIGNVRNSTFLNNSCGRSNTGTAIIISGNITDCKGQSNCFGSGFGTGANINFSGTMRNITATTFGVLNGQDINASGTLENITVTGNALICSNSNGTITTTSTFKAFNCTGTVNNFCRSDANITMSGSFTDCHITVGGGFGFSAAGAGVVTINPDCYFTNCSAVSFSFCVSTGGTEVNEGKYYNCRSTITSFGNSTVNALFNNCKRTEGYGTHEGTFEYCSFSSFASTVLTIATNVNIRYCTLYQINPGETIDGVLGTTANIYLCSLNVAPNAVNVTNNVVAPNNVVDANIIIN